MTRTRQPVGRRLLLSKPALHADRSRTITAGRIIAGVVALTGVVLTVGIAPGRASAPPVGSSTAVPLPVAVDLHPVTWVSGLAQPVQVTSANDGTSRLFVVEKGGRIRAVSGRTLQAAPYLDLRSKVDSHGDRGMLSVAFQPTFRSTRTFFVSYTRKGDGALVVSRFKATSPSASRVSASTEQVVFVVTRPDATNQWHNGGSLVFGDGGYLFISTGDGGGSGDPYNTAQSTRVLNGKILRIDVAHWCGGHRYCIPPSNPYATSTVRQRAVFARGFRNPWRMSYDAVTGRLWVGDVGQDRQEEIDLVTAASGGRNFGWSCKEGGETFNASRCSAEALVPPYLTICHPDTVAGCVQAEGGEAIIGGLVYRGTKYRNLLAGRYLFGDYITGNLWVTGAGGTSRAGSLPQITSFGTDDAGEPYAVTLGGSLVRLAVVAS